MPKKNLDRRTQRTRKALMSAFVELALTRGYEAMTTEEITRKANVGRSTFYLHYRSKAELLRESMQNPSQPLAACVGGDFPPQRLVPLLGHFREQRAVNRVFFTEPIRSLWVKALAALIEPRLILAAKTSGARLDIPRSLVALMLAEMQIALITHWLNSRVPLQSELIATTLVANTSAMLTAFGYSERAKRASADL
jgi:AcrR family transcriptional regulator